MLNQTGIKKVTGSAPVQILFNVQNQMSVGVKVSDDDYVTENGRKLVKAGTVVKEPIKIEGNKRMAYKLAE